MRSAAMDPKTAKQREERLASVEKELADLRQELAAVHELFQDTKTTPEEERLKSELDDGLTNAFKEDDNEFEGIWDFHRKLLVADATGSIPAETMYAAFVVFCHSNGKIPVDRDALEFLLPQMDAPRPVLSGETWQGCRFR